jgi:hypothetical protein
VEAAGVEPAPILAGRGFAGLLDPKWTPMTAVRTLRVPTFELRMIGNNSSGRMAPFTDRHSSEILRDNYQIVYLTDLCVVMLKCQRAMLVFIDLRFTEHHGRFFTGFFSPD